jgi:alpha-amylase/alpha-mannosidase (GH57 family)
VSTFLFGIHCHQPVDNFDSAINEAIERSYLPLFRTLSAHETFRFSVHFSGWLLDKIASEHPELFGLMETMSRRNQIEWLGGGYYEPILASIPSKDRRTQIDMLSDRLEALFGRRPRGIWLTERVWSDEIIGDLCACGIEYTLVDDYHFWRAGFRPDECEGYYLSESGGETIKIFPIQKSLRYLRPFSEHEQAIEAIASMKTAI